MSNICVILTLVGLPFAYLLKYASLGLIDVTGHMAGPMILGVSVLGGLLSLFFI